MATTKYSSDNRYSTVKINGKGPFIATQIELTEKICESSKMVVDFFSDQQFNPNDLGQVVNVTHAEDKKTKIEYFLLASEIKFCGTNAENGLNHFQVVAIDPLSMLHHSAQLKIYQNKTTKDIIEDQFKTAGLTSYINFSVSGTGQKHDYCIQFNEDGYDFVKRLCASEGWHFHCQHKSKVQLTIADSNQIFEKIADENLSYINPTVEIKNVVDSWKNSLNIGTNNAILRDFSFENAKTFDNTQKSTISQPLTLSINDYGYGTKDKSGIKTLSEAIVAGLDINKHLCYSSSTYNNLSCGCKFNLKNHPETSYNEEYIVIGITHHLKSDDKGLNYQYKNEFVCIPSKIVYKPIVSPTPKFTGTLTGTVTGPSDKEIYTDDKGRIKVLLHFDQEAKPDENASIWIPVAQTYASNGFGSLFLPRIGSTVLVTFLNGDINKPLVISSLYTDDQKLPFKNSYQSGFKTHSHPNGDANAANELRFTDQKDQEEFYIHAQKDYVTEVENDAKDTIKGNKEINIEKKFTTTTKEEVSHSTEKTYDIHSKDNYNVSTDADGNITTKGKYNLSADKDISVTTKKGLSLTAKQNVDVDGNNITITGKSKITLKVGSSKIEISSSGITIEATQITVKGTTTEINATNLTEKGSASVKVEGANIDVKASAQANVEGALANFKASTMATVEGSAMLTLKGGITRIN